MSTCLTSLLHICDTFSSKGPVVSTCNNTCTVWGPAAVRSSVETDITHVRPLRSSLSVWEQRREETHWALPSGSRGQMYCIYTIQMCRLYKDVPLPVEDSAYDWSSSSSWSWARFYFTIHIYSVFKPDVTLNLKESFKSFTAAVIITGEPQTNRMLPVLGGSVG